MTHRLPVAPRLLVLAGILAAALLGCGGPQQSAIDGDWLIAVHRGGAPFCTGSMRVTGATGGWWCGGDAGQLAVEWDGSLRVVLQLHVATFPAPLRGYGDPSLLEVGDGQGAVLVGNRREGRTGKTLGAPMPDTCDGNCGPRP